MTRPWGSIQCVRPGEEYRIRYSAETDSRGYMRHTETVYGTLAEARERHSELEALYANQGRSPTVSQVADRWYWPDCEAALGRGDLSRQTMMQYRSAWKCHVRPRWAGVPVGAVTPEDVQGWVDGLTYSQARSALSLLRKVLDCAVLHGLVRTNACDGGVTMPSRKTSEQRDSGIWTPDQMLAIWDAARDEWWEVAFLLSAFGSARVGESLGPWAEDVWECKGCAMVNLERQVSSSVGVTDRLKNEWSRRVLVVPGPMGERVRELAGERERWLTENGLGEASSQRMYQNAFREAVTDAGLPVHPVKNLRPSWETWAHWSLRIPQDVIEPLMGHIPSGSRVTAMHYDHPQWQDMAAIVGRCYDEHPLVTDAR